MENAIRQVLFESVIESWLVTLSYTLQYVLKTNKGHCKRACCSRDNTFCLVTILVVATAKCQRKQKEFAYITGFSSNVYQAISAAEARPLQALLVPTFVPCSWP